MKILEHFRNIENLSKKKEEIIEIECIFFFHFSDVGFIHLEDDRSEIRIDGDTIFDRALPLPFRLRNHSKYSSWIEFFFVNILTFHDFFYGSEAVVTVIDDKIFPESDAIDKHPQKKGCYGMESSDCRESVRSKWIYRNGFDSEPSSNTVSHLASCLISKGNTEYFSRINMFLGNHGDDPFGNRMGFS